MPMYSMNLLNHFYYFKKKKEPEKKCFWKRKKNTHVIVKPIGSARSARQYKMYGMCTRIIWPTTMFFSNLKRWGKNKKKICSQEESSPDFKLKYNSFRSGKKWSTLNCYLRCKMQRLCIYSTWVYYKNIISQLLHCNVLPSRWVYILTRRIPP